MGRVKSRMIEKLGIGLYRWIVVNTNWSGEKRWSFWGGRGIENFVGTKLCLDLANGPRDWNYLADI